MDVPGDYAALLTDLKSRIRGAQLRAALAVNRELVLLYWQIGQEILLRQQREGWGAKVIERLSADLRSEFPDLKGLTPRNLQYMQQFAATWTEVQIVQQLVSQIPWGHNVALMQKVKDPAERQWYARAAIQYGWSRHILTHQIDSGLYRRQGLATHNFDRTIPAAQTDLAAGLLKDPYNFDFLTLGPQAQERDLERGLLTHLRDFMLELGVGFAFVGSQYRLEVGGEDFFLDLLFYHLGLRCYVVLELKVGAFKPEYAGKLNFYLAAVDDLLRHPGDAPTIGLLLCRNKNKVVAEYALRDIHKPLGVATYSTRDLPAPFLSELPSVETLERELEALQPTEQLPMDEDIDVEFPRVSGIPGEVDLE